MTPNKTSRRPFWSLFDRNSRTAAPRSAGRRSALRWPFRRSLPLSLEQLESRVLPSVTVSTSKPHYAPGETAVITASGFQVGEAVEFQVRHTDGSSDAGAAYQPWQVIDGGAGDEDGVADGNITTHWDVSPSEPMGTRFVVTATGSAPDTMDMMMNMASATFNIGPASSAELAADKADYQPGETAVLTGSGFQPGETVKLQVLHTDGKPNTGPAHDPWYVTDGGAGDLDGQTDGNIRTTWFVDPVDSIDSTLQATATGLTSGQTAQATFTDASPARFYVTGDNGTSLLAVDETTGVATRIGFFHTGSTTYSSTYTGAFTPDGTFWTIVNSSSASPNAKLATVNLSDASVTLVGSTGVTNDWIISLDADNAGNLYAGGHSGGFYSVNKATGQMTLLGTGVYTCDFAFDNNGTLWAVDGSQTLWQINPATGAATNTGQITGASGSSPMTIAVDPVDNTVYISSWTSSASLYRLNTTTRVATQVGTTLGFPFVHGGDFLPIPSVSSLSQTSAAEGGPAFTLTVNGSNFASSSVVQWNGSPLATTFVSGTQLQATVPAADLADDGAAAVSVSTPSPGGGASNALTFTVTQAAPSNVQLTLSSATISENDSVTLNGSFVDPGVTDKHSVDIDWSDGSPHTKLALAAGVLTFSAPHQYLDNLPGNAPRTITATVLKGEPTDFLTTGQVPDALILDSATATVRRYNSSTGAFVSTFVPTISGGTSDLGIVYGPDGNLYVAGPSSVLRYDGLTGSPLPAPGNTGAFFVNPGSGGLSANEGLSFGFGPDNNLYVASSATNSILRYSGTTGAFLGAFVSGVATPQTPLFGPDGNLYVSSFTNPGSIERYNGTTGAPLPSAGNTGAYFVPPGSGGLNAAQEFAFGPDGNLYVVSANTNQVLRYSGTTGAPLPAPGQSGAVFVAAGSGGLSFGDGMAFGPDGNLYVASLNTRNILRYNGTTGAFLNVLISAGSGGAGTPSDLIFMPQRAVGTTSITVNNVPPTLGISGATSVDEGAPYTLNLSATDPGTDTITGWTITWGDGNTQAVSGNPSSVTHTYADSPNDYTITATATDEDGTYAATPVPVSVAGLVGWWRGEGNAANTIGAHDGTLVNGVGFTPGEVGQAFQFNGSNYVQIPGSAALQPANQVTLDGWIKPTFAGRPAPGVGADVDVILNDLPSGSGLGFALGLAMDATPGAFTNFGTANTVPNVLPLGTPVAWFAIGGSAYLVTGSSAVPNDGLYHQVAATYDGATIRLFLDGTQVGSLAATGSIAYGSNPSLFIGRENSRGINSRAAVDEASLYGRALSPAEIQTIVAAGSAGKTLPSLAVHVNNVPPTVTAAANQTATEGVAQTFNLGSFTDPGADSPWAAEVDWGDGSAHTTFTATATGTLAGQPHTFAEEGTYTVTVKVTDKDGAADSKTFTVGVSDFTPLVGAPYPSVVLSDNPVHYYRLEETSTSQPAADQVSSGGLPGTYVGGVTLGQPSATSKLGNAALFNGDRTAGTRIRIPGYQPTPAVTVEAWVKLTGPYNNQFNSIVSKWDGTFELDVDPNRFGNFVVRNNSNTFLLAATSTQLALGTWYHLVGTFDSGVARVYLNGVEGTDSPNGAGVLGNLTTNELVIGATRTGSGSNAFNFNGSIDEVAIYGTALSPARIRDHFNAGATVFANGSGATLSLTPTYTASGSFIDPGADTWTATVNYGDNSGTSALALNPDKTFSLNHTYAADGSYSVTVQVRDDEGTVGTGTFVVTVAAFTVTNTSDSGAGSLRQALLNANVASDLNTIRFNIPGTGVQTIQPLSALPSVSSPVVLDATTQPGYAGTPVIELNGAGAGAGANGLTITGSGSTVKGFVINRFSGAGIQVSGTGAPPGAIAWWQGQGNANDFLGVSNGTPSATGVSFASGEVGQAFSFNGTGSVSVPDTPALQLTNGFTIEAWVNPSTLAGKGRSVSKGVAGARGYSLGRNGAHLELTTYGLKDYDTVGNYLTVGVWTHVAVVFDTNNTANFYVNGVLVESVAGPAKARLASDPLYLGSAQSPSTGQPPFEAWNGLLDEITIYARQLTAAEIQSIYSADGRGKGVNVIQGNFIGTSAAGTGLLGNANGVVLTNGASYVLVGGTAAGAGNVISGNSGDGVQISGTTTQDNVVQGNRISTDVNGTAPVPNGSFGVEIGDAANNVVGGTASAARNIISGGSRDGIGIDGIFHQSNQVFGNWIGLDANGNPLGNALNGIFVDAGGNELIRGNVISSNHASGITLNNGTAGNRIEANFIGTDPLGGAARGNAADGIMIANGAHGNVVGGAAGTRNLISGNAGNGITLTGSGVTGNLVQDNYIGTDANGTGPAGSYTGPLGNLANGVQIDSGAANNTIGGSTATPGTGLGNVISGNHQRGVGVFGGNNNLVAGNIVGLDAGGSNLLGNFFQGVELDGGTGNAVGGTSSSLRNVISGNGGGYGGILIGFGAVNMTVQGNYIGTDISGARTAGNAAGGIFIVGASNNTIGGTTAAAANVISANGGNGIFLTNATNFYGYTGPSAGNVVQGNLIGTDFTGSARLGNTQDGVLISANANTAAGNVISGNAQGGVVITAVGLTGTLFGGAGTVGATANLLQGNFIGTNAAGAALGNGGDGVRIQAGATSNTVGGTVAGARNVISGNAGNGLAITHSGTTDNMVLGNDVGIASGALLPNATGPGVNFDVLVSGVSGAVTFGGTLTAGQGGINVTATDIRVNAGLSTASAPVTFTGPVTLGGTAAITTRSTGAGAGITFNGTVTLNTSTTLTGTTATFTDPVVGGGNSLTVAGDAVFGDAATDTVSGLNSLSVSGTTTVSAGAISSTGSQSYAGAVTLGANTTLSAGASDVTFGSTVTGPFGLTVNSSGNTNFEGAVTTASLTTDAGGTAHVDGGAVTTSGTQSYGDAVALGADTTLTGTTATFLGTLSGGNHNLAVTGNAVFGDAATDTVAGLSSLTVSGTTAINTASVTTSGTQTYSGAVTLGADATLTGTMVTTLDTVNGGGHSLTVSGNAVLGDAPADAVSGLSSLAVSGTTAINTAAVSSTGTQTYSGAVTLGADTTLTATTATFLSTLTGAGHSLTVSGNAVLGGAVSGLTTLAVLGTTTVNTASVSTSSTQTYGGATTLGADTTLAGTTVTFNDPVTGGGHSLTVSGNAVFGNAAADTVTGLTALTVSGSTLVNTSTVTSSGAQSYGGAVTLGTDATLTGTNLTFSGSVNSLNATARSLTLGGSGDRTFAGPVGTTFALATLSSTGPSSTTRINAGNLVTTGAQTFGVVTLGANAVLSGTDVTFQGGVDSFDTTARALTVNASGVTTFGGAAGAARALARLITDAAGTTALNGGAVTTTDGQTYNDPVTLGAGAVLTGTTIAFNGTLSGGNHSLTVTGSAVFGDAPADAVSGLTSLAVSGTTAINTAAVMTSGTQTYSGAVTLGADTTLTATTATFLDTLTGAAHSLTVSGGAVFGDAAADTVAGLSALAVSGAATVNTAAVTTSGTQTYSGPATLGTDTTLTATTASFLGTVTGGGHSLTVTGNAVLGDAPADAVTGLGGLAVSGTTAINTAAVSSTGTQTYAGAVTLGADTTLTAATATFQGTLTGAGHGLTVSGNAVLGDEPADTVSGLSSLAVSGATTINTATVTTTGSQTYSGPVTLGTSVTLNSGTGNVTFGSTVSGTYTLTINSSGTTTFSGDVGGTTPLAQLVTDPLGTTVLHAGVSTTGDQTFNDPVQLTADVTLTDTGTGVVFAQTVDGPFRLTIKTPGVTTFGGAVGGLTPLVSLSTDAGGSTKINGGLVRTTGAQTYGDPVTLGTNTALTASTVPFNDKLSGGGNSLTVTGDAVFGNAPADAVTGLSSLSVSGTTTVNTSTVSAGALTFGDGVGGDQLLVAAGSPVTFNTSAANGPVTVNAAVTLTQDLTVNAGTGPVTFNGTIDGHQTLTVNTGGATTFNGNIGGVAPLKALITDAPGATVANDDTIHTAGDVTVNDAFFVQHDLLVIDEGALSTGITFNGTVDSFNATPHALTAKSNRRKTFSMPIGHQYPLASLTMDVFVPGQPSVPTQLNAGEITTTGDQNYNDATNIGPQTSFNPGGSLSFGGAVTGLNASLAVKGGPNTQTIDLSQAEVPVTLQIDTRGQDLTGQDTKVLKGGKKQNTFIKTEDQHVSLQLEGGPQGSANVFDVVAASQVTLVDRGGQNTIDLSHATLGITLDLNKSNGEQQFVYLTDPTLGVLLGETDAPPPTPPTNRQNDSIALRGRFQKVVGGTGDDVIIAAKPQFHADGTLDLSSLTTVVAQGGHDTIVTHLGTKVTSLDGGDTIISGLAPEELSLVAGLTPQELSLVSGLTPQELSLVAGLTPQELALVSGLTPQELSLVAGLTPQELSLVAGLTPQELSLVAGLTPQELSLVGGLTPQELSLVAGLTPQELSLVAGLTPQELSLVAGLTPQELSLVAGLTPQELSLVAGLTPQELSLVAGLTPQELSLVSGLTPQELSLVAGLTPQEISLVSGLTPQELSLVAGLTPQELSLVSGLTPQELALVGGLTPQELSLVAGLTPQELSLVSGLTPQELSLVAGLTPQEIAVVAGLTPQELSLVAGLTPQQLTDIGGLTPQELALVAGLTPQELSLVAGLTPQEIALVSGLTPQELSLVAGLTPQELSLVAGLTPQEIALVSGLTPQELSLVAGLTPQELALVSGLTPQELSLVAGLTPQELALVSGLTPQELSLVAGLTPQELALVSGLTPQELSLVAGLTPQELAVVSGLTPQEISLVAGLTPQELSLVAGLTPQELSLVAGLTPQELSLLSGLTPQELALVSGLTPQELSLLGGLTSQELSLLSGLSPQELSLVANLGPSELTLLANLTPQELTLLSGLSPSELTLLSQLGPQEVALLSNLGPQELSLLAQLTPDELSVLSQLSPTELSLLSNLGPQELSLLAQLSPDELTLLAQLTPDELSLLSQLSSQEIALLANLAQQHPALFAILSGQINVKGGGTHARVGLLSRVNFADDNNVVGQSLSTAELDVVRKLSSNPAVLSRLASNLTFTGGGNSVIAGLLTTVTMGDQANYFEERMNPDEVSLVNDLIGGAASPDQAKALAGALGVNVFMGAGNDVVAGGSLGHFHAGGGNDLFFVEDPTMLGASAATSALTQFGGTFEGGSGQNTYYFVGQNLGNVTVDQKNFGNGAANVLDFSGFLGDGVHGLNLDLAKTTPQAASPGLNLTLTDRMGISNVVGTRMDDTILGNDRDNQLSGGPQVEAPPATPATPHWDGRTQYFFLDFDSATGVDNNGNPKAEHVYTPAERAAILARLAAIFGPFEVQVFTSNAPGGALYGPNGPLTQAPPAAQTATVLFNQTPPNGKPGGFSQEVDWRNLNQSGAIATVVVDINGFLGGTGEPADTSADAVAMSANIAGHEMLHGLGVGHPDAFGPIGSGVHNPPGPGLFVPAYPGPEAAVETTSHVIVTPASEGSTLFDLVGTPYMGERELVKLAFGEQAYVGQNVLNEQSLPAPATTIGNAAYPVHALGTLPSLYVPNTMPRGLHAGENFDVNAVDVLGSIVPGTDNVIDPITGQVVYFDPVTGKPGADPNHGGVTKKRSASDYYSFTGQAGDLINIQVMSQSLARIQHPIDSVLRVWDSAHNLVAYYTPGVAVNDDEFESADSSIVDLRLPASGTYFVEVDTFTFVGNPDFTPQQIAAFGTDPRQTDAYYDTGTGDYELFIYRFGVSLPNGGFDGNDTLVGRGGNNVLDGGTGTNTVMESGDVNFTLSRTQLTGPGTDTLKNFQNAVLTGGPSANSYTLATDCIANVTINTQGGADTLVAPGSLTNNTTVVGDLASASVVQNLTGTLTVQGNVAAAAVGGTVANTAVVAVSGNLTAMTVGPDALSAGHDLAGRLSVGGTLGGLRVAGGTPGTIVAGHVGSVRVYGGYGPLVAQIKENGIQRRIEVAVPGNDYPLPAPPPAATSAASPAGVTFQYVYESGALANPQLTIRVTNPSAAKDQFDVSLVTYNDAAKFNLARLDATGASGIRNVAVEGDLLTSITSTAATFLGLGTTTTGGVRLPSDALAGVAVRDYAPNGFIQAKSIQAVAFGSHTRTDGLVEAGAAAKGANAARLLVPGTAIVQALDTFRVPFADLPAQQVGFFLASNPNGGYFDDSLIAFTVQGVSTPNATNTGNVTQASNAARGAVVGLVKTVQTFNATGQAQGSAVQSIDLRGDGGSIQTQQAVSKITSTGPLGDLILKSAKGTPTDVTAPSIFGNVDFSGGPLAGVAQTTGLRTDPITGATSTVSADWGRVYVAFDSTGKPFLTTTFVHSAGGGVTGQLISRGRLLSQVVADGGVAGTAVIAVQGDLGVQVGSARLGGITSNGPLSGSTIVLGNLVGDSTINGGLKSGRLAVNGSVLGNLTINGTLDGRSALVVRGNIGTVSGTTAVTSLWVSDVQGILATEGSIVFGKTPTTSKAAFYGQNVTGTNKGFLDAIFTQDGTSSGPKITSFGLYPDLSGLNLIVTHLGHLTASGGKLASTSGGQSLALVSVGGNASGSNGGHLVLADLWVYVDNANGLLTPDEMARIDDTVNGLNTLLAPYGVTVTEVDAGSSAWANIVLDMSDTTDIGGAADGVLGVTMNLGTLTHITLVNGWNWYTGGDAGAVGPDQYDYQTVVTHELGHALGLGHSADPNSTMFALLAPGAARRALSVADLNLSDNGGGGGAEPLMAQPFFHGHLPGCTCPACLASLRAFLASEGSVVGTGSVQDSFGADAGLTPSLPGGSTVSVDRYGMALGGDSTREPLSGVGGDSLLAGLGWDLFVGGSKGPWQAGTVATADAGNGGATAEVLTAFVTEQPGRFTTQDSAETAGHADGRSDWAAIDSFFARFADTLGDLDWGALEMRA
jgi:Concanavalin A-like lectin/glucanases superfamily/PKD domain/Matrixin